MTLALKAAPVIEADKRDKIIYELRKINIDDPSHILPTKITTTGEVMVIKAEEDDRENGRYATPAFMQRIKSGLKRIHDRLQRKTLKIQNGRLYPKILAVIPALETEDEIGKTIESLLTQWRVIDKIVVVVNGPGRSDVAYEDAMLYAKQFPDNVVVERPINFKTGKNVAGKVNALNWAYNTYIARTKPDSIDAYTHWLGVDADVEADSLMVQNLEREILNRPKAAGVSATYSFRIPEDMGRKSHKSRSIIYGQRSEFAFTEMKHQMRNNTTEILGGQATLYDVNALRAACRETYGNVPWDSRSKVEDAQLTRIFRRQGLETATCPDARAWTGLMFNASSWQKQRRKWQDGQIEDMTRDFHPWIDRRLWMNQIALGWNLLLRVMFWPMLIASISLHQFIWSPIWLTPIGLAMLQGLLVAIKLPDRRLGEVINALTFVSGEIYYMRVLSVWLDSVILAIVNVKRDGWHNQAKAEAGTKRTAMSGWVIIALAILIPIVILFALHGYIPTNAFSLLMKILWSITVIMTAISTMGMTITIVRILRHYRYLRP